VKKSKKLLNALAYVSRMTARKMIRKKSLKEPCVLTANIKIEFKVSIDPAPLPPMRREQVMNWMRHAKEAQVLNSDRKSLGHRGIV
jgi:hypothetical protein